MQRLGSVWLSRNDCITSLFVMDSLDWWSLLGNRAYSNFESCFDHFYHNLLPDMWHALHLYVHQNSVYGSTWSALIKYGISYHDNNRL